MAYLLDDNPNVDQLMNQICYISLFASSMHRALRSRWLIGPPDPVSNLRPVLYTDPTSSTPPNLPHPYSLQEFAGRTQDQGLQWRLQRQQLDAFNHSFWTDVKYLRLYHNCVLIFFPE